jgi:hypothetical protein
LLKLAVATYCIKFICQGRGDYEEPGGEFSKEEHLAQSHALAQVILILTQNLTTLELPQNMKEKPRHNMCICIRG